MKYKKIAGQFGSLDGELELHDGLNVIYAPNESGKSTWCALIRAVLYGVDTSEHARKDALPVKTKYKPWSGRPAFGRIVAEHEGRELVITRSTSRETKMMQDFSAVYADTSEPVPGLDAANAGETLVGVPGDVFARSLFCTGEQMQVTENGQLERKIAAIAGTGDDEVSAKEAVDQLGSWKRERRYNQHGRLPEIEAALRENEAELAEISRLNGETLALSAAARRLTADRDRMRSDLTVFERRRARRVSAALEERRAEAAAAAEKAERFRQENAITGDRADPEICRAAVEQFRLASGRKAEWQIAEAEYYRARTAEAECDCPPHLRIFEGCTAEFAAESAEADRERASALLTTRVRWWLFPLAAVCIAAGILLTLPQYYDDIIGKAFCALLCGAGLVLAGLGIRSAILCSRARAEGAALCRRYGVTAPSGMTALAGEYTDYLSGFRRLGDESEKAARELEALKEKYEFVKNGADRYAASLHIPPEVDGAAASEVLLRLSLQYEQLRDEAERTAASAEQLARQLEEEAETGAGDLPATRFETEEETRAALAHIEDQLMQAERSLAACDGRLSHYRDLAAVSAENGQLRQEQTGLELDCEAIELAKTWITASADELSARLTPAICRRAGELFTAMTGGKYGELTLDKHFLAQVCENGEVQPHSMLHLSRGALDQLYLSVRLALSEVIFDDPLPPLVLDDCLAAFDDDRAAQTMELLRTLAEKRQILFFTCRKREMDSSSE